MVVHYIIILEKLRFPHSKLLENDALASQISVLIKGNYHISSGEC
jgi:hypothetical protein